MANHRSPVQHERRLSGAPEQRRRAAAPPPASALQFGLLLCAALMALVLLYLAVQMLNSAFANSRTEQYLQHWQRQAREPSPQAWQAAAAAAQRAVDSYPVASGRYLDRLGQVHAWCHMQHPVGDPLAAESRHAALQAYSAAVEARPSWPNTWARLAHTHYALGDTGSPFTRALEQANLLGPYRPAVQEELASIGLSTWPQLSNSQRDTTLDSARQVLNGRTDAARDLLDLAQSLGLEKMLCRSAPPSAMALCKNRGIRI